MSRQIICDNCGAIITTGGATVTATLPADVVHTSGETFQFDIGPECQTLSFQLFALTAKKRNTP